MTGVAATVDHQFLYSVKCDYETVCATGSKQDTTLVAYSIDTASPVYIKNWI